MSSYIVFDSMIFQIVRSNTIYEKLFDVKIKLRTWSQAFGFQVVSKELVEFKRALGLPLGIKENISIPEWIKENPVFAKRCLRGIFDTDGTLYLEKKNKRLYPRIQIKTVSKILVTDIEKLLNAFGFIVNPQKKQDIFLWLHI